MSHAPASRKRVPRFLLLLFAKVSPVTPPAPQTSLFPRKSRNLAQALVDELTMRVRSGALAPGAKLPTEAEIMAEFGVSRTVVREAISRLQASGLMQTRHGVGTFVNEPGTSAPFHITADQLETLHDVIAMLELRIGLEAEAAALAALRRTDDNLRAMREAQAAFWQAVQAGEDAVHADFQFHLEIARATQNLHFSAMLGALGSTVIPRARIARQPAADAQPEIYLERVHAEHESIIAAIACHDAESARTAMRIHLGNSRERRRQMSEESAMPGAGMA